MDSKENKNWPKTCFTDNLHSLLQFWNYSLNFSIHNLKTLTYDRNPSVCNKLVHTKNYFDNKLAVLSHIQVFSENEKRFIMTFPEFTWIELHRKAKKTKEYLYPQTTVEWWWATVWISHPATLACQWWSWSWNLYELRVTVIKTGFLLAVHIFSDRDHHRKKKFYNYAVVIASLAKLLQFMTRLYQTNISMT